MASGFGTRNGTIETYSDVLQYVWLEAFTPKQCNESLMRNLNYPDQSLDSKISIKNLLKADNFICTWSPRKDVCKGDSGGPLVKESGPKKALVLVGILSRAIDNECAGKEFPSFFIDVRKEADWIYKAMKKDDRKRIAETPFESEGKERIHHVSASAYLKLNTIIIVFVIIVLSILI